jgi:hypothetical protein
MSRKEDFGKCERRTGENLSITQGAKGQFAGKCESESRREMRRNAIVVHTHTDSEP